MYLIWEKLPWTLSLPPKRGRLKMPESQKQHSSIYIVLFISSMKGEKNLEHT